MSLEDADAILHAEMIRMPDRWAKWPWLPMVRRAEGARELGLIHSDDAGAAVIRVFAATPETGVKLMADELIQAEALTLITQYSSVEELVNEGWRVDG